MRFECSEVIVEVVEENGRRVKRVYIKDPRRTRVIPCEKISECEVCVVEPTAFDLQFMGW